MPLEWCYIHYKRGLIYQRNFIQAFNKVRFKNLAIFAVLTGALISCKAYRQDIMFQLDDNFPSSSLSAAVYQAEQNYRIQKNDFLRLDVYTNKGERIVDPNNELINGANQGQIPGQEDFLYLVQEDGFCKFPIIGKVNLMGMTIDQAEKRLEDEYNAFYKDSFVKLQFQNKRVILLGATGGQVITLRNENTSLVEVLAQSGGIQLGSKAQNIKIIRGDLNKPEVYAIDLSTIEGMKSSIIRVQPGDVIYVEPWRRVWLESIRDIAPVLSLVTSILTLAIVLQNLP